jgi:glyceraldehyde 3-phosphate dehydrogenase
LLGINSSQDAIISNGSCTTNAVANFLNILDKEIGIKKAVLNTIHAYTANQNLVDNASKDFLRGRNANLNIIPTTTNAAVAVTNSLKNLKDKFNGLSVRVPVACGSLADVTFISNKPTSKEEIEKIILKNIQKEEYSDLISAKNSLVSSDIIQSSFLGIIDLDLIQVIDKDLIKICV